MSVGKVREFDIKNGNWSAYIDRVEMYFVANKITVDLKLPTLIALIGEEAYELLSTLTSPKKPSELSYEQAVDILQKHLQPKPSEMAERYRFRQRRQRPGETIADYVADLKKMSRYCEFKAGLEENLRDQFVCGLRSELIRQRLFAEDNLSYKKALALANTLEAAERDAGAVDGSRVQIYHEEITESVQKLDIAKCSACGDSGHRAYTCKYKEFECSYCGKTGHLRRACLKKESDKLQNNHRGQERSRRGRVIVSRGGGGGARRRSGGPRGAPSRGAAERAPGTAHWLREPAADDVSSGEERRVDNCEEPMYQMSLTNYKPVCITLSVNDMPLNMEIDTGAAVSCISKATYLKQFKQLLLKPCSLKLAFYNGSKVRPLGYLETKVKYGTNEKMLDLYVIDNGTTTLLGRQWLFELDIDIPKITNCKVNNVNICKNQILKHIISRHENLFDGTLGKYTGEQVKLHLRDNAEPIFCRARPVPYALLSRVDRELDAMLRAGVIEPVDRSDWATPLVIARKADGGIRLCADYKVTLNKALLVDRYPVPKIEDLFSDLGGNNYFTKLDLSQAYNQLVLDEQSRNYTVINTHRGLFKYNRLVYGLSSSPGIFQKCMVNLFKNVPGVIVFYDDILIKSKSWESNLKRVEQVFDILEKNGLKIRKDKCEFMAEQVKYLGFIVEKNGVRVDPEKVKPILSMPHPSNVSELKSFLGMVNFYGKFIKNLSHHISPLYELLKKGKHWKWTFTHSQIFQKIKKMLCSTEVLTHFDRSLESIVTCDASARGLGAVLAQSEPGGGERVVAYASRALTPAESHYSQIHKEALAIIFAVDKFHQYLFGRKFKLRTDHKPLVTIFGMHAGIPNTAASRLQRWAIKLSAYDFDIEYIRTDKNTADVLSRLINTHKENAMNEELDTPEQTYLHFAVESLLLDYKVLKKETASDQILSRVIRYINDGWPNDIEINELKPYFNRRKELYSELGCIMWGHRVVVPSACRSKVISELHESHMGIVKTKSLARSYVWWPGLDEAVEAECRACSVCAAVADAPPAHAPSPWPWPDRPWTRLHVDFLGPIAGVSYLIVVDAHSKWIEAIKMSTTTTQSVIKVLRDMWSRFGLPKQLVSDNGPPFFSSEFKEFLNNNGIDHIFSAPYHPASNGAAENAVKICKRTIKKAFKAKVDIHAALCRFLLAYRNTPHYTTGESPAKMLLGRSLRMRLDCLKPDRGERVRVRQTQVEAATGGVVRQFNTGDPVWFREYHKPDKWTAGTIVDRLGRTDYKAKSINGTEVHRHVDQLRSRALNDTNKNTEQTHSALSDIRRHSIPSGRRSRPSLLFPVDHDKTADGTNEDGEAAKMPSLVQERANEEEGSPSSNPVVPSVQEAGSHVPELINNDSQQVSLRRIRKPVKRYGFDDNFT